MTFDHDTGWIAIAGFLDPTEIDDVSAACVELLALPPEERAAGDKPESGTRHLRQLDERSDVIAAIVERPALLAPVTELLGPTFEPTEISYRSPQPSFGGQRLHADDVPKLDDGPADVATSIVALVDFTDSNGSTRVVPGSHRRPDLQRLSGSLDRHPDEIQLTGRAGTAFVFSGHVLHSGTPNRSNEERPALQLVWRRR